jgi:hypothetical protein
MIGLAGSRGGDARQIPGIPGLDIGWCDGGDGGTGAGLLAEAGAVRRRCCVQADCQDRASGADRRTDRRRMVAQALPAPGASATT